MVVRRKTLGEVNININISDKTKPKKKKRRKATKRKGTILAPNFGSVAPIFPAYSFGTAERSKQEEEQFKTKELLLLTQGELKDTRQKLLEYNPVPSVGRSQAPKTIQGKSVDFSEAQSIPSAPALIRQQSDDSKRRNEARIKVAREEFDAKRLSTMRAPQLPTFDRTPTTNIRAQETLKPPPLIKPIVQRSDSVRSDLTEDSMRPIPDQPPAQALGTQKQDNIQTKKQNQELLDKVMKKKATQFETGETAKRESQKELVSIGDKARDIVKDKLEQRNKFKSSIQEELKQKALMKSEEYRKEDERMNKELRRGQPAAAEDESFESAESSEEEASSEESVKSIDSDTPTIIKEIRADEIKKKKEDEMEQRDFDRRKRDAPKTLDLLSRDTMGNLKDQARKLGIQGTQKYKRETKQQLVKEIMKQMGMWEFVNK